MRDEPANTSNLKRPREFQRDNQHLFRTYSSLRYHLDRRGSNGLLESGAVVETPLGILIETEKFPLWLRRKAEERAA